MPLPDPLGPKEEPMPEAVKTLDQADLDKFMANVKEFMNGVKTVVADKDLWMFTGAFFVNYVGKGSLTVEQAEKIDRLKEILSKQEEMTYAEAGTVLGVIASLLTPAIEEILKKQAPGVLNVIGLLTRLGGVL